MADVTLVAQERTELGKGAARRSRREGLVPAVIYGHQSEPRHVLLPGHETFLAIRNFLNGLYEVAVAGESVTAIVKDVQIDPLKRTVQHVDFLLVSADEKVEMEVSVVVEGEPAAGAVASLEILNLVVEAPAASIPEEIIVSIEGAEAGHNITVADIKYPAGVTPVTDGALAVVVVNAVKKSAEEATEEAAE